MTTIRNLAMEWWNNLLIRSKINFIRQYVDGITPTTSLTPEEIENIFYQEIIVKWWDNIEGKFTMLTKYFPNSSSIFDTGLKEIYLKEHTKEEQIFDCQYCNGTGVYITNDSERVECPACENGKTTIIPEQEQPKEEKVIEPTQPYFKGKGEHSVNELEKMCQQYKDYISHINSQPKEEVDVWDEVGKEYVEYVKNADSPKSFYNWVQQHYTLIKKQ